MNDKNDKNEIHWLLLSLNKHLHFLDEADEAYTHIQCFIQETAMWREKYADEQNYTDEQKITFLTLHSSEFYRRSPDKVFDLFVKAKKNDSDNTKA